MNKAVRILLWINAIISASVGGFALLIFLLSMGDSDPSGRGMVLMGVYMLSGFVWLISSPISWAAIICALIARSKSP